MIKKGAIEIELDKKTILINEIQFFFLKMIFQKNSENKLIEFDFAVNFMANIFGLTQKQIECLIIDLIHREEQSFIFPLLFLNEKNEFIFSQIKPKLGFYNYYSVSFVRFYLIMSIESNDIQETTSLIPARLTLEAFIVRHLKKVQTSTVKNIEKEINCQFKCEVSSQMIAQCLSSLQDKEFIGMIDNLINYL